MNMIAFATDLPPPEEPATNAARCGQVHLLTTTGGWFCQCSADEAQAAPRAALLAEMPFELTLRHSSRTCILERRTV